MASRVAVSSGGAKRDAIGANRRRVDECGRTQLHGRNERNRPRLRARLITAIFMKAAT